MMTREKIRAVVTDAGHGAHADAVDALIQPSIRVRASALAGRPDGDEIDELEAALAELPLGASRFGGVPDLPPGVAWPDREGVPMEFIAQIRLADVAGLDPEHRLPPSGSLIFFYNSQWGTTDSSDAPCCAVIFHDGADDALVRATPPRVEWKSEFSDEPQVAPSLHGLAELRFEPALSVPGGVSPFVADDSPLGEIWQDFHSGHHAALAGDDEGDDEDEDDDDDDDEDDEDDDEDESEESSASNYLLGYVDEQDYVDAHANGTADQLLLQVDSDDAADFQFGDCNKLFFLLTKEELAARDFTKVRVYSSLG